ncbi:hypothetical protein BU26DRAFT_512916, partial [Trematosphaeria pertusa]
MQTMRRKLTDAGVANAKGFIYPVVTSKHILHQKDDGGVCSCPGCHLAGERPQL